MKFNFIGTNTVVNSAVFPRSAASKCNLLRFIYVFNTHEGGPTHCSKMPANSICLFVLDTNPHRCTDCDQILVKNTV